MKQLTPSFICSVLIIASVSIVSVAATINSSFAALSEKQNIIPVEPKGDFYACFTYPFCYDPDDFKPAQSLQTEPNKVDKTQKV